MRACVETLLTEQHRQVLHACFFLAETTCKMANVRAVRVARALRSLTTREGLMPPYAYGGHLQVHAKSIFCTAQKRSFPLRPWLTNNGLMCDMSRPKKPAAVQNSAVLTLVELPLRHDVWRRHFRLHLRMERLDVPSKRQRFQLTETSCGGNGRVTSAPDDARVMGAH